MWFLIFCCLKRRMLHLHGNTMMLLPISQLSSSVCGTIYDTKWKIISDNSAAVKVFWWSCRQSHWLQNAKWQLHTLLFLESQVRPYFWMRRQQLVRSRLLIFPHCVLFPTFSFKVSKIKSLQTFSFFFSFLRRPTKWMTYLCRPNSWLLAFIIRNSNTLCHPYREVKRHYSYGHLIRLTT